MRFFRPSNLARDPTPPSVPPDRLLYRNTRAIAICRTVEDYRNVRRYTRSLVVTCCCAVFRVRVVSYFFLYFLVNRYPPNRSFFAQWVSRRPRLLYRRWSFCAGKRANGRVYLYLYSSLCSCAVNFVWFLFRRVFAPREMLCAEELMNGIDEGDGLSAFKSPIRRLGSTRKILYFNSEFVTINNYLLFFFICTRLTDSLFRGFYWLCLEMF